jgi:DNA-directed RNA polymerase III subunit RPC8
MFILSVIQEKIKISPENFSRPTKEVIIEQIDMKFANRILHDVGLCICFYGALRPTTPLISCATSDRLY